MKSIYQESILILSMKRVLTTQGIFLIGIATNEKFYFDFLSSEGDYFMETNMPVDLARSIWTGDNPRVIQIENVEMDGKEEAFVLND